MATLKSKRLIGVMKIFFISELIWLAMMAQL